MWSQLLKIASTSKGALVVGVAASAAMVSNAEFSNTPSHNELPSATPIVAVTGKATPTAPRPANSPSSPTEQKKSDGPTAQLPVVAPSASPQHETAGSFQHGEVPGVIKECVEKYLALREAGDSATNGERESTGAVCKAALAVSGLTGSDFWAKFGSEVHATAPKTDAPKTETPKHSTSELSPEVMHWIQECVTTYTNHATDASQACIKAIQLTGLTSSQFAERFLHLTNPTTTPSAKPATAELEQLVAKCLDLYKTITSTGGDTKAASDACRIAIQASGLSSADFWAKYHPTTATN